MNTPRDTLAGYSTHGLAASAGVWLRATGNGDQHHPMGP